MAQTASDRSVFRTLVVVGLVAFSPAEFLYGQAAREPVAIPREPVDKPAVRRPLPAKAPVKVEIAGPRPLQTQSQPQQQPPEGKTGAKEEKSAETKSGVATSKQPPGSSAPGKEEEVQVPEGAIPPEFEKMCPVGRSFYGVRIPSYSGDQLNSVVTSDVMTRVDEEHLDMEKLVIQVYSAGQPDAKIMMDKAIYDMDENKLTSRRTPPEILHSQFKMVGDKMIFDRETEVGHMEGNVKMTIFSVDSFLSESDLTGAGGQQ